MAVSSQVLHKMSDLVTAGLGLVAALAWNSAIQSIFVTFMGTQHGTILGQVLYAIMVTVMAVFVTVWIGRLIRDDEKKK